MILVRPRKQQGNSRNDIETGKYGHPGYAIPVEPIRVVLARDEEAAGIESEATKLKPPAYGLWRESVVSFYLWAVRPPKGFSFSLSTFYFRSYVLIILHENSESTLTGFIGNVLDHHRRLHRFHRPHPWPTRAKGLATHTVDLLRTPQMTASTMLSTCVPDPSRRRLRPFIQRHLQLGRQRLRTDRVCHHYLAIL